MRRRSPITKVALVLFIFILLTSIVFAASGEQMIKVIFNNQRVYVDGTVLESKDNEGNPIEPFTYKGVTYYSLNALAKAFGKRITTDNKTGNIQISSNVNSINYPKKIDALNPILDPVIIGIDYSNIDAYKLERNSTQVNIILEKEGSLIRFT